MKNLFIIGAGGFGREVAGLVERINTVSENWHIVGFLDDNTSLHGTIEGGYPILGGCDYLQNIKEDIWVVCAVGASKVRKKIIEKVKQYAHVHFATVIDPSVIIINRVKIGEGTIICAGSILTVDCTIGNHVIINLDCTIGHDAILRDFVTLYPSVNVSGCVDVGEQVELGTGMQIIQGIKIVENSIIGAGAVVIRNIDESGTYVGSPARKV